MKRNHWMAGAVALALASGTLAGQVLAAQGPIAQPAPEHDVTRAEAEAAAAKLFDKLDANHDGKLDAADRVARRNAHLDKAFDRLDTNHDGSISREEFRAAHQHEGFPGGPQNAPPPGAPPAPGAPPPGMGPDGGPHDGHHMADGDHGGDRGWHHGGRAGMEGHMEIAGAIMHTADPNHSGTITRAAFIAAAMRLFDEADTNHDGKLTGEERAAEMGRLHYRLRQEMRDHPGGWHHDGGPSGDGPHGPGGPDGWHHGPGDMPPPGSPPPPDAMPGDTPATGH